MTSQALAFSPDSELLAVAETGCPNKQLTRVQGRKCPHWDVRRRALTGAPFRLTSASLDFSPDGELLAAAGRGRPTEIRKARGGKLVAKLHTAQRARSVAPALDGSSPPPGISRRRQSWSTPKTREPVGRPLEAHEGRIVTLDFARDGRTLASASEDGTVVLWGRGHPRTPVGSPLTVETNGWTSRRFHTPRLATVRRLRPGSRRPFRCQPRGWKRHACRVAGREFTARASWQTRLCATGLTGTSACLDRAVIPALSKGGPVLFWDFVRGCLVALSRLTAACPVRSAALPWLYQVHFHSHGLPNSWPARGPR